MILTNDGRRKKKIKTKSEKEIKGLNTFLRTLVMKTLPDTEELRQSEEMWLKSNLFTRGVQLSVSSGGNQWQQEPELLWR